MPTETSSDEAARSAGRARPNPIAAVRPRAMARGSGLAAPLALGTLVLWKLVLGTLVLAPAAALAQQPPPEQRYYQVEVLVFAQQPGASVELPPRQPGEVLVGLPGEPAGPDADDTTGDTAGEAPGQVPAKLQDGRLPDPATLAPVLPESFGPPRAAAQLADEAARLERNGYRVLWHQAWIQAPSTRDGVPLELLSALGQGPVTPALTGSIDLSTGRFLHLGMDLELRSAAGLEAELTQRRRIRPDELHYFDHPRIGAIAIAQRIERALATEWQLARPGAEGGAEALPGHGPVQPPRRP